MEELVQGLKDMSVSVNKTGFVYHTDMMKHTLHDDEIKSKNHVENPYRLKRIVDRYVASII